MADSWQGVASLAAVVATSANLALVSARRTPAARPVVWASWCVWGASLVVAQTRRRHG